MKCELRLPRACLLILLVCCGPVAAGESSRPDFDREIAPLLIERCLQCHAAENAEAGLDLSRSLAVAKGGESGPAVIPGDPTASRMWQRIAADEMPPEQSLSAAEKLLIRRWIASGARWGSQPIDPWAVTTRRRAGKDWWSLQPIDRPAVPSGQDGLVAEHPIDAFVARELHRQGLQPAPPAAPQALVRRLYFDLIGLPPSWREVNQWVGAIENDRLAAIDRLVTHLITSRHYGERWARHWLDVVRFGESQGFERDKLRPDSWHYRQWVIDALNQDLPYDEFVRLQVAGDILHGEDAAAITATGFLVAGPWDEVGQSQRSAAMRAVVRQDELEDYIGTIGQTFLGLTVNCARCHDHKFDPILQSEYYQLAASLAGVHHGSREVTSSGAKSAHSVYAVKPAAVKETFVLSRGNPALPGELVRPGGLAAIGASGGEFELENTSSDAGRRRALARWITDQANPLPARVIVNRLWHYHFGSGLVATPNDFGFNGGRPSHPELLDWLAAELIHSDWSLKHIHRLIVTSQTFQQSSRFRAECGAVDAENKLLWRKSPMRLEAETLRDALLCVSGELNRQYGGEPYRDFITSVNNSQFYEMTDPDHPDACRRTVYRTWIRSGRNHMLDVFDCPDPSTTAPKRAVTTTPIQTLSLMNNSFVLRMSDRFANQIGEEFDSLEAQATGIYQAAYGRTPDQIELAWASEFIDRYGASAFCRVVFNSNEFIYID